MLLRLTLLLTVCVVYVEEEAAQKKRKREMHQEAEQQEAAVAVSTLATDLEGVALSVSVTCWPRFRSSSSSGLHQLTFSTALLSKKTSDVTQ